MDVLEFRNSGFEPLSDEQIEELSTDYVWYFENTDNLSDLSCIDPTRNSSLAHLASGWPADSQNSSADLPDYRNESRQNPLDESRSEQIDKAIPQANLEQLKKDDQLKKGGPEAKFDQIKNTNQLDNLSQLDNPFLLPLLTATLSTLKSWKTNADNRLVSTLLAHQAEISGFSDDLAYCDSTLSLIENILGRHHQQLHLASSNIAGLHSESIEMSIGLETRRALCDAIKTALNDFVIPSSMINTFFQEGINQTFVETLVEFERKIENLGNQEIGSSPILGHSELQVSKLKLVVTRKIYDFFIGEIVKLATPKTNVQVMQTGVFLRFRGLYEFLYRHHYTSYGEVRWVANH